MSREWEPGDVAMVQNEYGVWNVAILQVQPLGLRWVYGVSYAQAPTDWPTRPLVVIDPEDREQVERLTGCLAINGANPNDRNYWQETQAALREFADPKPLRPAEPTGLGAVVEDAEADRWIRDWKGYWRRPDMTARWTAVNAVRVLSEGVQQ